MHALPERGAEEPMITAPPEMKDLMALAESGLSEARRSLEQTGNTPVVVMGRLPNGSVERLQLREPLNEIMNSGPGKDVFFGAMRKIVERYKWNAVIFVTDAYAGLSTPKQHKMMQEQPEALVKLMEGASFDELVEAGLVTRAEALSVTVQNAQHVFFLTQFYERDDAKRRITWGERREMFGSQADFDGRQKMYGKEYLAPDRH